MTSSVTTDVPSGPIKYGCISNLYDLGYPPSFDSCANSTLGYKDADFESICCDGDIVDSSQDIWNPANPAEGDWNLANLVCCRTLAPQQGGIQPIIQGNGRTCTGGTATPLASLAATNTGNAQIYPVTFLDASGEPPNLGDFTFTQTPRCLWALTEHGVIMTAVTVPAANITTLPIGWPNSDDPLITPIITPQTVRMNTTRVVATRTTQDIPASTQLSISSTITSMSNINPENAVGSTSITKTSSAAKPMAQNLKTAICLTLIAAILLA